ncbi:MAG: class I SAM-dependent methyltransferase [Pseudomonadota bacterium]
MSHSSEVFWDRYAPKYAAKPIADPSAYEAKLSHVRTLLAPTDHVLEIGCGTGSTALNLAPSCAHITGSDISGKMIGYARSKKGQMDIQNVRFVHANAERSLSDGPFDKVLAFSLLHLLPDAPAALRTIHDQLKPGGLFISKTVCLTERNAVIRLLIRALRALRIAPDVKLLSQVELMNQIERAGFELVETRYFGDQSCDPFIVARRND